MSQDKGWFIYALGSGWGHLNRALALAKIAARDRPIHLLTNSPYADRVIPAVQPPNLIVHQLPLKASIQKEASIAAARECVVSLLQRVAYDCLIVDTFPRGLVGELADVIPQQSDVRHVLVHRDLNPDYVAAKAIAPFVSQHYNCVLIPGEVSPLAHLSQSVTTAPWLSRSAADLPAAESIRRQWKLTAAAPLVVVCGAGQPDELAFFGLVTERIAAEFPTVTVRCLAAVCPPTCAPERWLYHWPGMDILQLADVVIGGGGYNLVHECSALGKPLLAFAQPRRYDRQARRIQQFAHLVSSVDEAIARLTPLLSSAQDRQQVDVRVDYLNGVGDAIAHIQPYSRVIHSGGLQHQQSKQVCAGKREHIHKSG